MDALRGAAALLVVVGHLRTLLVVDYEQSSGGPLLAFVYGLSGLGREAVMVFFVLSGYWVGGSALRRAKEGLFDLVDYARRRLVRLWIVLVPALVVTYAADSVGRHWFGATDIYGGDPAYHLVAPLDLATHSAAHVYAGNAAFLQTVLVPTAGSNGALWSLAYEFFYYAIFAGAVIVVFDRGRRRRWLAATAIVGLAWLSGGHILGYLTLWTLGAVVAMRPAGRARNDRTSRVLLIASASAVFAAAMFTRAGVAPEWSGHALIAMATAALIVSSAAYGKRRVAHLTRVLAKVGPFSFSLYAVHLPLAVLGVAALRQSGIPRLHSQATAFSLVVSGALLLVVIAKWFAWLTESRTDWVRRRLGQPWRRKRRTISRST
jgi:peptidoglycan/LPS O-acetylase OafA/YrhL